MEKATEGIIRLLLTHPKKGWVQAELAGKVNCSRAFVSKLMSRLEEDGIVARPYKNRTVLVGFSKLLNKWVGIRRMPKPIYYRAALSERDVEERLKREKGYALTLFRAAWHRTHFMRTTSFEMYAGPGFGEKFGKRSDEATNFAVYPSAKSVFEGVELIDGLKMVSPVQNYVDLMSVGGSGSRVAKTLGEKYGF